VNDLLALADELENYKKEMMEKGQSLLQKYFNEFFEDFPEVKGLKWEQYTPYFNDGDECIFHVYFGYITFKDIEDEDEDEYLEESETWIECWSYRYDLKRQYGEDQTMWPERESERYEAIKELEKTLTSNPEILKSVFGDHCRVLVTPGGAEVSECYHD
jgi:hypothetical protein